MYSGQCKTVCVSLWLYLSECTHCIMCRLQDLTALVADFGLARMFQPLEKESNKARGARRRWVWPAVGVVITGIT